MRTEYDNISKFQQELNVDGQIQCRGMVSRKISLFGRMQRGKSPSFELFQLDMNVYILWFEEYCSLC